MKIARAIKEQFVILDQAAGWRESHREHLALTKREGFLTLDPLPGGSQLLFDEETQKKEFVCPSAIAVDGCGNVLVADAATHSIKQFDLARKRIQTLPAIGGEGQAPRRLKQPRGVAWWPSGAIVVSDTGNDRVQAFSPPPYALLQVWGDASAFRWPWGITADACGLVYIADRGNHRVRRIRRNGTVLPDLGTDLLREPTRLALGPDDLLAVVDPALSAMVVFSPGRQDRVLHFRQTEGPRAVTFGPDGKIYVGDAIGLIHVLEPRVPPAEGYRLVGAGDSGVNGEIVDLTWAGTAELIAIIREKADDNGPIRQRLWQCASAAAFAHTGHFFTKAIDSGIERCQWHRILLDATVPAHTSVQIDTFTSDDKAAGKQLPKSAPTQAVDPSKDTGSNWKECLLSGDDNPDCLVQGGPGQYLWLRLTLASDHLRSPVVRSVKAFFPRDSYLQYLPAVFQEDDDSRRFLERFLSVFQTEFDSIDGQIDRIWQLFDPASVREKDLAWLASWLALIIPLDPQWPSEKKRSMLKEAFRDYRRRGTLVGLEKAVRDYAGVTAKVLEHFRLRRWPALSLAAPLNGSAPLWSRDFYRRVQETAYSQIGYFRLTGTPEPALEPFDWGAHKFTVFFPAHPYRIEETKAKVSSVVEREKPVHTEAELCPVLPRFRVGVQATVGVDTLVAGITHTLLTQVATLNYDTILACSPVEQQVRRVKASPRPHVGQSSRLE